MIREDSPVCGLVVEAYDRLQTEVQEPPKATFSSSCAPAVEQLQPQVAFFTPLLLGDLTRADWPKGWALLLVCQLLTQHTTKTNMERCVIIFFQMADCPLVI